MEAPSQAERLADVSSAGAGASDRMEHTNDPMSEKIANPSTNGMANAAPNASSISPSPTSSDVAEAPKPEKTDPTPQRSALKTGLIMFSLCMAVFLAALDTTIITTAVPTITERFQASEADYSWIGSAYLLAAAASTPTWGKFSDIWGRKPILLFANIIFFVGSLIAALSINIKMLLAGRVIQGTGGGGLIILANICISDLFSMRERGKYFGMVGATWGLASAVGPVLGGVFTQRVSWRWCFYINLPFDGLCFAILLFLLDIETPKTPIAAGLKAIDWLGVITITGGTVMFLLGLEYGGVSYPWDSATVICLIVFGLVTICLFFINEWKLAKYPVMPLRLFKRRSNIASLLVCFTHGFVFISGAYFLPLYFQAVLGADPILSGVYLFPFVLSMSFISVAVGIFIKKTGQYLPPIWFGMTFMTIGFGLYIDLPADRTWAKIFAYQVVAGLGVGPNFQAPLIALQSLVEPRDIATATATFGFIRNIGTSVSVVLGGVIFQNRMMAQKDIIVATVGPQLGAAIGGGGAGAATSIVKSLPQAQKTIIDAVYTHSLRTLWIFYTAVGAVGVVASLLIGRQTLSRTHEVTKTGLQAQEEHRLERKEEKRRSRMSADMRKSGDMGAAINDERKIQHTGAGHSTVNGDSGNATKIEDSV